MKMLTVIFIVSMAVLLYANETKGLPSHAKAKRSIKCSKEWCSEYCESNLSAAEKVQYGHKFMARCLSTQECQCLYPWRKTTDSMMTWSRTN